MGRRGWKGGLWSEELDAGGGSHTRTRDQLGARGTHLQPLQHSSLHIITSTTYQLVSRVETPTNTQTRDQYSHHCILALYHILEYCKTSDSSTFFFSFSCNTVRDSRLHSYQKFWHRAGPILPIPKPNIADLKVLVLVKQLRKQNFCANLCPCKFDINSEFDIDSVDSTQLKHWRSTENTLILD